MVDADQRNRDMDTNKALSPVAALMKHSMSTIPRKTPRQEKRAMFKSEGIYLCGFHTGNFLKIMEE